MKKQTFAARLHRYIVSGRIVYLLLIATAGMMGAYTFTMRGGTFCNAQTANIAMMAIAFGQGRWSDALYFIIPICAYFMGAFLSELLLEPDHHIGKLRWDTCLVMIEMVVLFIIGFIPMSAPVQIVQILINFIASMQYNTFRQSEGVPMATTFCTNHLRQLGIASAQVLRRTDRDAHRKALIHLWMMVSFLIGGIVLSLGNHFLQGRSIWLALFPLTLILVLLLRQDLRPESKP